MSDEKKRCPVCGATVLSAAGLGLPTEGMCLNGHWVSLDDKETK